MYMHFNCRVKIVQNFTKRKTKLYTKTLHALTLFVLVGFASEIIVSISSKVKIIKLLHFAAILLCNKNFMHSNIARPCVVVM